MVKEQDSLKVGQYVAFPDVNSKTKFHYGTVLEVNEKENTVDIDVKGTTFRQKLDNNSLYALKPNQLYDIREISSFLNDSIFKSQNLYYGMDKKSITQNPAIMGAFMEGKQTEPLALTGYKKNEGVNVQFNNDARLRLQRNRDGKLAIFTQWKKPELDITPRNIRGIEFSEKMFAKLQEKGHIGKVEAQTKDGRTIEAYVSLDKKLNDVAIVPAKLMERTNAKYYQEMSPTQKSKLEKGDIVTIKNYNLPNGEKTDLNIVADAVKAKITSSKVEQKIEKTQSQGRSM